MTNTTTKAAFARACKVTKPGIAKAILLGLVVLEGKKVNLDHRLTHEYYFKRTGKKLRPADHVKAEVVKPVKKKVIKRAAPVKKKPIKKETPVKPKEKQKTKELIKTQSSKIEPIEPDPPQEPDPDDGYRLPKGIKSFEDITIHNIHLIPIDLVKKWKELEATKKSRQDRDTKRGKLIDKGMVEKVFAKIHTVDTNQWKTLENKIAPDLCSLFKAQDGGEQSIAARKLINSEVTKILKYTKRIIDDFLKNNKELAQ